MIEIIYKRKVKTTQLLKDKTAQNLFKTQLKAVLFGFATKLNLLLSEIYITQRHKVAYYIFEKTNLAIKEIIKFALIKNPALKCLYFMAFLVKILVSIFGDSSYVSFACVAFVACETIFWGDCVVNSDRV